MNPPDQEDQPAIVQIPAESSTRKLRESAILPPPDSNIKQALESTGRLPVGEYRYQMSDVLALAIQSGASDLHLRVGEPPVYRVDGKLIRAEGPPINEDEIFNLLTAFTPEDSIQTVRDIGQADFGLAFDHHRFRVNVFRAQGYWGGVLRRIPEKMPQLEDLLAPQIFYDFTQLPRGLVLVTGPTGSGKSTTLAAMIDKINKERKGHIITVEDPIEFIHRHQSCIVNQREVGTDTKSFQSALKYALREDPDVILVGELRDLDTIASCLTIAETGHLALATLHTNSAAEAINRIIDVFPSNQQSQVRAQLAFVLEGVVTQTLLQKSKGKGRAMAAEILIVTPAIRALIRDDKIHQIYSAMQSGKRHGMQTMNDALYQLYTNREIAVEEALRVSSDPVELARMCGVTLDSDPDAAPAGKPDQQRPALRR
jgi:twitching motility protein PilT